VIRVNRAEKLWAIDRSGCVQCASCVEVCPKKCLLMKSEAPASRFKKGEEVFQNA
jgi:formate hydrogenlyase subunit 6/NADH:ubiquinone oxidoreductase subunit I